MIHVVSMLAAFDPVAHILDVPWRIAGRPVPWMSGQIGVMILAAIILAVGAPLLARRARRRNQPGMGVVGMIVEFVRLKIARVAMGPAGDRAVGYLATLLTFLLLCNLLSLVPLAEISGALGLTGWGGVDATGRPLNVTPVGGTPASTVWVCASFAAMTFALVILSPYAKCLSRLRRGGANQVHSSSGNDDVRAGINVFLGLALWLLRRRWPLPIAVLAAVWVWLNGFVPPLPGVVGLVMWPLLLVLEIVGYVAKCFALCIRLVANLTSGHILLAVLIGFAQASRGWLMLAVGVPAGIGVLAVMGLELLVAVLQAYIFTFLSALFIGLTATEHH